MGCNKDDPYVQKPCSNCKKSLFCSECIEEYACERCTNRIWICKKCKEQLKCSVCIVFKGCNECLKKCGSTSCPNKEFRICQACLKVCPACKMGYCNTCSYHIQKCPSCKQEGCSSCLKICPNELCKQLLCTRCTSYYTACYQCREPLGCPRCAPACGYTYNGKLQNCKYLPCTNSNCTHIAHGCSSCEKVYCSYSHYSYMKICQKCKKSVCLECGKMACQICTDSYICPACSSIPNAWPKQECQICQTQQCIRCMKVCPLCDLKTCSKCEITCNKCKKALCCKSCKDKFWKSCENCQKAICRECIKSSKCVSCEEKNICCGYPCHVSQNYEHKLCTPCRSLTITCSLCKQQGYNCKICYDSVKMCMKCKICAPCLSRKGLTCSKCSKVIGCSNCNPHSNCLFCKNLFCKDCFKKSGVKGCYSCKNNYCNPDCFQKGISLMAECEGQEKVCPDCQKEHKNPPLINLKSCVDCQKPKETYSNCGLTHYETDKHPVCRECCCIICTVCRNYAANCFRCYGKIKRCESCGICTKCIIKEKANLCKTQGCNNHTGCQKCSNISFCTKCLELRENIYKKCIGCRENLECSKCQLKICTKCSLKCNCSKSLCRGCAIICGCAQTGFCKDCLPTDICNSCGKTFCSKCLKAKMNCGNNIMHLVCGEWNTSKIEKEKDIAFTGWNYVPKYENVAAMYLTKGNNERIPNDAYIKEKCRTLGTRCMSCLNEVCLNCDSESFICSCQFICCGICKPNSITSCSLCNNSICKICSTTHHKQCSTCKRTLCPTCVISCLQCGEEYSCQTCFSDANWCKKHRICEKCISSTKCVNCNAFISGCFSCEGSAKGNCHLCKKAICLKCLSTPTNGATDCLACFGQIILCAQCEILKCNSCQRLINYCSKCAVKCSKCGYYQCKYCIFSCKCEKVCKKCIPASGGCVNCGIIYCPKCNPNISASGGYCIHNSKYNKTHTYCKKCNNSPFLYGKQCESCQGKDSNCLICHGSTKNCEDYYCKKCPTCINKANLICDKCKLVKCESKFCSLCKIRSTCVDCDKTNYMSCSNTYCNKTVCKSCSSKNQCLKCNKNFCPKCTQNTCVCALCKAFLCSTCSNSSYENFCPLSYCRGSFNMRNAFYCPTCKPKIECKGCKKITCPTCQSTHTNCMKTERGRIFEDSCTKCKSTKVCVQCIIPYRSEGCCEKDEFLCQVCYRKRHNCLIL